MSHIRRAAEQFPIPKAAIEERSRAAKVLRMYRSVDPHYARAVAHLGVHRIIGLFPEALIDRRIREELNTHVSVLADAMKAKLTPEQRQRAELAARQAMARREQKAARSGMIKSARFLFPDVVHGKHLRSLGADSPDLVRPFRESTPAERSLARQSRAAYLIKRLVYLPGGRVGRYGFGSRNGHHRNGHHRNGDGSK